MDQLMTIFVTGSSGSSVVFGVLSGDRFTGADIFGSSLDGTLQPGPSSVALDLDVRVPAGVQAVQGVEVPHEGLRYRIIT